MEILLFLVSFLASTIGSVCGIGGGVLMKPLLDAFQIMSVSVVNFLSGCTVLTMSVVSLFRGRRRGGQAIRLKTTIPLGIGAALGGILGKYLFAFLQETAADSEAVGAIQAACLLTITVMTLLYTLFRKHMPSFQVTSKTVCVLAGIVLGMMSSFLGIGGGPINLVVLFLLFSMDTKTASRNSLYIIMLSQAASLLNMFAIHTIPRVKTEELAVMILGGVLGGITGAALNRKISNDLVNRLFIGIMVVIIMINIYNLTSRLLCP